jgi:hypothetical protein
MITITNNLETKNMAGKNYFGQEVKDEPQEEVKEDILFQPKRDEDATGNIRGKAANKLIVDEIDVSEVNPVQNFPILVNKPTTDFVKPKELPPNPGRTNPDVLTTGTKFKNNGVARMGNGFCRGK